MRVLAVALLLGMAAAAPARAERILMLHEPAAHPVLAADGVAWARDRPSAGFDVLWRRAGVTMVVGRFPRASRVSLAGTPTRLTAVVERWRWTDRHHRDADLRLWSMRPGEERLLPRTPECLASLGVGIVAAGDLVAYDGCDGPAVADLGSDPATIRTLPPDTGRALAGDLLATADAAGITVSRALSGEVVYRVAVEAPWLLDAQADGKVLFRIGEHLAWSSPAEPGPHPLGLPLKTLVAGRLAGDRAVVSNVSWNQPDDAATLHVVGLDGSQRLLTGGVTWDGPDRSFDFDGRTVTWASLGCDAAAITVAGLDEPDGTTQAPRCPLVVDGPIRRLPRLGPHVLRVPVSCVGVAAYCATDRLEVRTLSGRLVARQVNSVYARSVNAVRAALTPFGRFLLKRTPRVRVVVSSNLGNIPSSGRRRVGRAVIDLRS